MFILFICSFQKLLHFVIRLSKIVFVVKISLTHTRNCSLFDFLINVGCFQFDKTTLIHAVCVRSEIKNKVFKIQSLTLRDKTNHNNLYWKTRLKFFQPLSAIVGLQSFYFNKISKEVKNFKPKKFFKKQFKCHPNALQTQCNIM